MIGKEMDSRIARVAVSMMRGMNVSVVRAMHDAGIGVEDFPSLPINELNDAIGIGKSHRLQELDRQEAMAKARKEVEFMDLHKIQCLYIDDEDYPHYLAEINDAPIVLYKLGPFDLNSKECISIVGTRRCSVYGTTGCDTLVEGIAQRFDNIAIVSGLAFGIDAAAHRAALKNNMPTVGVVAHGLDMMYPAQHRQLAADIIKSGGCIVSEYPKGGKPYRNCFLERNRIVAGLSTAVVVMESEIKGGAMSTAGFAFGYDREVFALPGRVTDPLSAGCNHLISRNKAKILIDAVQLGSEMGWKMLGIDTSKIERNLFPEMEGDNRKIYDTLRLAGGSLAIDELHSKTGLSVSALMSLLSELEFDGILMRIPGNRYTLV